MDVSNPQSGFSRLLLSAGVFLFGLGVFLASCAAIVGIVVVVLFSGGMVTTITPAAQNGQVYQSAPISVFPSSYAAPPQVLPTVTVETVPQMAPAPAAAPDDKPQP